MRIPMHRIVATLFLFAFALILAAAPAYADGPASAPAQPGDPALNAQLAENFCMLALEDLRNPILPPAATLRRSEALLQYAVRLNPDEPRYARLLADAAVSAHDLDTAAAALKAYTMLVPRDETAAVQRVSLKLKTLETSDAELKYLDLLLHAKDTNISSTLRARFAMMAENLCAERHETSQAQEYLMQAIRLDPLFQQARRMWVRELAGNERDEFGQLLAMLLSNPAQPDVINEVAREMAAAGMVQDSMGYFQIAFGVAQRNQLPLDADLGLGYATETYISGDPVQAINICQAILQRDNANYDVLSLAGLACRGSDQQNAFDKLRLLMQNVLVNHLTLARQGLIDKSATTRPVDSADKISLPDFTSDLATLKDKGTRDDQQAYAAALGDLIWFNVYYNQDVTDVGRMLDALQQLEPENSVVVARLTGWYLLLKHEDAKARDKFTAIADTDPLAQLGLIRLNAADPTSKPRAVQDAQRLVNKYPAGMIGATIVDGTRELGVHAIPQPSAVKLREDLAKFPTDWLSILDQPQRFYVLKGEPLAIAHDFGDPLMVRIQIDNISQFPITIGRDGIVNSDLLIDAQTKGVISQSLPGIAVAQLPAPFVLDPGKSVSVIVRVDQGKLNQILYTFPQLAVEIFGKVRANPANGGQVGAGGYPADFSQIMVRDATPNATVIQRIQVTLAQGQPADKLRALDVGSSYIQMLSQLKDVQKDKAADFARQIAVLMRDAAQRETTPDVVAWANFRVAPLIGGAAQEDTIAKMIGSDNPTERLLGLLAGQGLGPEKALGIALKLADDSDAIVKAAAAATADLVRAFVASTQPAGTSAPQTPVPDAPAPVVPAPETPAPAPPTPAPTPTPSPATTPADTATPTPSPATAPKDTDTIPLTTPSATLPSDVAPPATVPAATEPAPVETPAATQPAPPTVPESSPLRLR